MIPTTLRIGDLVLSETLIEELSNADILDDDFYTYVYAMQHLPPETRNRIAERIRLYRLENHVNRLRAQWNNEVADIDDAPVTENEPLASMPVSGETLVYIDSGFRQDLNYLPLAAESEQPAEKTTISGKEDVIRSLIMDVPHREDPEDYRPFRWKNLLREKEIIVQLIKEKRSGDLFLKITSRRDIHNLVVTAPPLEPKTLSIPDDLRMEGEHLWVFYLISGREMHRLAATPEKWRFESICLSAAPSSLKRIVIVWDN
jgi:hypothetical protein